MSRKKRTAGDDEDVPVVQKRVKTRAQTQQRAEEEAQGLIATTRGMFTLHSFVLLKISYHLEGSRRVKEKAEKAKKAAEKAAKQAELAAQKAAAEVVSQVSRNGNDPLHWMYTDIDHGRTLQKHTTARSL